MRAAIRRTKKTRPKGHRNNNHNPTGKGGFADNPQNRGNGRWKKEDSIGEQYKMLIRMTYKEFNEWEMDHPEDERTVAQDLAHRAVVQARSDLKYLVEVTDRTEGKAPQTIDHSVDIKEDFDERQIRRIAERVRSREEEHGDTPG